jgi:hypothetical protein
MWKKMKMVANFFICGFFKFFHLVISDETRTSLSSLKEVRVEEILIDPV